MPLSPSEEKELAKLQEKKNTYSSQILIAIPRRRKTSELKGSIASDESSI